MLFCGAEDFVSGILVCHNVLRRRNETVFYSFANWSLGPWIHWRCNYKHKHKSTIKHRTLVSVNTNVPGSITRPASSCFHGEIRAIVGVCACACAYLNAIKKQL